MLLLSILLIISDSTDIFIVVISRYVVTSSIDIVVIVISFRRASSPQSALGVAGDGLSLSIF